MEFNLSLKSLKSFPQISLSLTVCLSVCLSLSVCAGGGSMTGGVWSYPSASPLVLIMQEPFFLSSLVWGVSLQLLELSPRQAGKLRQEEQGQTSCDRSVGLESRPVLTCLYPPFRPSFSTLFYLPFISPSLRLRLSFFVCPSICMAPCPHSPNRIVGTNKRCYLR